VQSVYATLKKLVFSGGKFQGDFDRTKDKFLYGPKILKQWLKTTYIKRREYASHGA